MGKEKRWPEGCGMAGYSVVNKKELAFPKRSRKALPAAPSLEEDRSRRLF